MHHGSFVTFVLYAARSSLTGSISWAKRMSFSPLSKLTVKSSRPRFSRCETSVPGVARRTIPPRNTMVRAERQRVPGTSDMAVSFLRSGCSEGGQVEARPLEGSAEPHAALVHHADDGGDHLGLRAGVLSDRIHEIEERDARCHRRTLRCRVRATSMPGSGQRAEGAGLELPRGPGTSRPRDSGPPATGLRDRPHDPKELTAELSAHVPSSRQHPARPVPRHTSPAMA